MTSRILNDSGSMNNENQSQEQEAEQTCTQQQPPACKKYQGKGKEDESDTISDDILHGNPRRNDVGEIFPVNEILNADHRQANGE